MSGSRRGARPLNPNLPWIKLTALYSLYRSQRFDDLVGQEAAARTLKNALVGNRVAHAYLFTGIRGTGKTSTARILAKAVNCKFLVDGEPCNQCVTCVAIGESSATDLIEIDAASNRGVDEISDLREKARYLPALLSRKVYIIDEAHQLTNEAFNALLKTLEEPPPHVLFILCTTEAHKLPATIVSRCQRFEFRRIGEPEIAAHLGVISEREQLVADPGGLALIASMAQGSMRDAITMLDQLASAGVDLIDEGAVRRQLGLASAADVAGLLGLAAVGDAAGCLRELDRLAAQGTDLRQLVNAVAEIARRAVLLGVGAADAATLGVDGETADRLAPVVAAGRAFAAGAFEASLAAAFQMKQSHDPRLVLELLLLRLSTSAGPVAPALPAGDPRPAAARPEAPGTPPTIPAQPVSPAVAVANSSPARPEVLPAASESAPTTPANAGAAHLPAQEEPARPFTGSGDLGEVIAGWGALRDSLRGSPAAMRVRALLNDAAPTALEDDLLTVSFKWAMHSEKAQEPTHRQELERALAQTYGRTFRLQLRVDPAVQVLGPGRASAGAAPLAPSAPASPLADDDDLDGIPEPSPAGARVLAAPTPGEGLVRAAAEIMGARITDVRPNRTAE